MISNSTFSATFKKKMTEILRKEPTLLKTTVNEAKRENPSPITPPLFDTGQSYRVMMYTSRLLSFGLGGSLLLNITLGCLVISLFPLKEIQPMLLSVQDKGEQVVKVEPFETTSKGHEILTEALAKQYVQLREAIDLSTEEERWKQVQWMSSDDILSEFLTLMGKDNPHSSFAKRLQERVTRSVIVKAVSRVSSTIIQVEWQSIDLKGQEEIGKSTWVSTLTYSLEETHVEYENRYMNPLGFTVTNYSVAQKG